MGKTLLRSVEDLARNNADLEVEQLNTNRLIINHDFKATCAHASTCLPRELLGAGHF